MPRFIIYLEDTRGHIVAARTWIGYALEGVRAVREQANAAGTEWVDIWAVPAAR